MLATDEEVQAVLTSFGVILSTTFLRIFTVASSPLILSLPASTVIMTAESALLLADILAAESEYDMPATDEEAQAALPSFGVIFIYTRASYVAARANLRAGLALLHTHLHDAAPLAAVLSVAQHQTLATALSLDYKAHGSDATAGPALLLHARGRSRTSTDSAPCSCGPSSASGPCALITGGVPPSAGPAPGLRGQLSGRAVRPDYDHLADTTVTSAAVRRPPERPARRCCFAPRGGLALPPARRRAPAGRPPYQGCAP